jgi:hypothetical protein
LGNFTSIFGDYYIRAGRFFIQAERVHETRQKDHAQLRVERPYRSYQLDSVHFGHLEIGNQQIEKPPLRWSP